MQKAVRQFESLNLGYLKKIVNLAAKQGLAKCLTIVHLQIILPRISEINTRLKELIFLLWNKK